MAQTLSVTSECSLVAQRVKLPVKMTSHLRRCAVGWVAAFALGNSAAVSGCKVSPSAIFDWAPVSPVDGPQAGGGGTGVAGSEPTAGRAVPEPVAGAAGGIQGESGSAPPPPPAIDKDARFEWTETRPGRGKCTASSFVGSYTCATQTGLPGTHVNGTLVLSLSGPNEAQQLDVDTGTANLLVDPTSPVTFMAPVVGKAMCMDKSFYGQIPETMFAGDELGIVAQLLLLGFCSTVTSGNTVRGTLDGKLDPDGSSLRGSIVLTIGACECKGSYDLRAQR